MQIIFNQKYNIEIIWTSEDVLPILIDLKSGKELKPFKLKSNTKWSYPMVKVNDPVKGELFQYVHKIVCYSFNDGYSKGFVVDHINGNVNDYRPTNLRYLSRSDNAKNCVNHEADVKKFENLKLSSK